MPLLSAVACSAAGATAARERSFRIPASARVAAAVGVRRAMGAGVLPATADSSAYEISSIVTVAWAVHVMAVGVAVLATVAWAHRVRVVGATRATVAWVR